ncbi:MAG: stage II sporulation protein R [Butyribacter sp.]|nr:stage II sporulation protein R [Butyribacter sp.]
MLHTPKIILQLFVYSMTFALLLTGFRLCAKENTLSPANVSASQSRHQKEIQEDIADHVVRLHIIANSDTDADQQLKMKVRDEIISSLQNQLKNTSSVADARKIILEEQAYIQAVSQSVLRRYDCDDMVTVSLVPRYFPEKKYGDLTFPEGVYQALCVEIGKAAGHNWWCVLFPSLCFVDETTAVVPDSSKEKLQQNLSEEAYDSLEEKPEIRSGFLDWFSSGE